MLSSSLKFTATFFNLTKINFNLVFILNNCLHIYYKIVLNSLCNLKTCEQKIVN